MRLSLFYQQKLIYRICASVIISLFFFGCETEPLPDESVIGKNKNGNEIGINEADTTWIVNNLGLLKLKIFHPYIRPYEG